MLRKIIASIVSLILVCNVFCFTSFAQTTDTITLSEYAQSLSSLIQKYSYDMNSESSAIVDDSSTNRLIIKTKDN